MNSINILWTEHWARLFYFNNRWRASVLRHNIRCYKTPIQYKLIKTENNTFSSVLQPCRSDISELMQCLNQVSVYFHHASLPPLLQVMTWYLTRRADALHHRTAFRIVLSFLIESGGLCGWGQKKLLSKVSECQYDMQGQACDSGIISSADLILLLLLLLLSTLYLCLLFHIYTYSHCPLFSSSLPTQPLASLLFTQPRPPVVCPPLWAFTQLLEKEAQQRCRRGVCVNLRSISGWGNPETWVFIHDYSYACIGVCKFSHFHAVCESVWGEWWGQDDKKQLAHSPLSSTCYLWGGRTSCSPLLSLLPFPSPTHLWLH